MTRKKPTKTQRKKRADQLFSLLVRAKGFCVRCAKTRNLQCAHVMSRRYLLTRWDLDNAVCLCQGCHLFFTMRPLEWEDWAREYLGDKKYEDLRKRARKLGKPDYDQILERLEQAS